MHSCVTSKNVKWCHLIWPTLYITDVSSAHHTHWHNKSWTCKFSRHRQKRRSMVCNPVYESVPILDAVVCLQQKQNL